MAGLGLLRQVDASNRGMHPTADTPDFICPQTCGAAGDAGRWAAFCLNEDEASEVHASRGKSSAVSG